MQVLVTGTLGYDYIMDFPGRFADRIMPDKIHNISLSFLVDTLNKNFGGTAGNISYSLKLLGLDPLILAPAGNDFGPYKEVLKKNKISTEGIQIHKDVSTSSYFVVTDKDDNQIGSFYVGATKYAKDIRLSHYSSNVVRSSLPAQAGRSRSNNKNLPFVIIAPTDPSAMKQYVKECKALQLAYIYDPAFQIATFTAEDLRDGIEGAQLFIGNDYEVALVQEKLRVSHDELVKMVPVLITTVGNKGSIIETRKESIHIKPAKPNAIVDPTGAGDAYRAGFLAGYLKGFDLAICGQMGSVASVYTVEKYGTITHTFSKKEFSKRFEQNFGRTLTL